MTNTLKKLCTLGEIPEGQSKGFNLDGELLFAVRQNKNVYVYRNTCPHIGLPLEWQPDQFLSDDNSLIQCATHGALFEIDTGKCIYGPCSGKHLSSVETTLEDEVILVSVETPTEI